VPYTAPDGDLDLNGVVDVVDLQCMTLIFDYTKGWEEFSPAPCVEDGECVALLGADSLCRPGFDGAPTCVPACLHPDVLLSPAPPGSCDEEIPETDNCLGGTWKAGADLDCDGAVTTVDFSFIVAVIMEKVGGAGTADHDADGRLNFCDADSDDDGLPDPEDCAPLDQWAPSCDGKECGDDGCGGSCGSCPPGNQCQQFICGIQPNLLVSDPGTDQIFRLDTLGEILDAFASPVSQVKGVTHDLRTPLSCWVVGSGDIDTFYKLDLLTGEVLASIPNQISGDLMPGEVRGLSYALRESPEWDVLFEATINSNKIHGVYGNYVETGFGVFKTSYWLDGFQEGYWGVDAVGDSGSERWATNYETNTIEHWIGSSFQSSLSCPIDEPRGLAMGPAGSFWVIDRATQMVVRLNSAGQVLGSFPAPGSDPHGISYYEE